MKKLETCWRFVISLIFILILVNCYQAVMEISPQQPYDMAGNDEGENEEEIPMEVSKMNDFTVGPVDEYPAYYVAPNGQVFGIDVGVRVAGDMDVILPVTTVDKKDIEKIPDQFFVIDGIIHFSMLHYFQPVDPENPEDNGGMVTKYCKQTDGVIEYLDETAFPALPDVTRGVFDDGEASLKVGDYNGEAISVAKRDADVRMEEVNGVMVDVGYEERFGLADGMVRIDKGYMIHVIEGRGDERLPGLLYWPDGTGRMDHMGKDAGRFWGM